MKKLILLSLVLFQIASVSAWDFYSKVGNDTLFFTITDANNRTVQVTYPNNSGGDNIMSRWENHIKPSGNLVIPNTVSNGGLTYSVTSIYRHAFSDCNGLTSVTIPNSITSIGEGAFYYCSGLTSITIPNSVISIGNSAFLICSSLTSITIPNSVTYIGDKAFSSCSSLTSVTIPNSVISIGNGAFSYCSSLTSVTIPNSVTSISDYAFYSCSGLTSITIPNSVTYIDHAAFEYCSSLTKTNYTGSIAEWCNINFTDFTSNPVYYSKNLYINNQLITDLKIPNGVDTIKNHTFTQATCLTSLTIPSSVTYIGKGAFGNCNGLTSITFEGATPLVIGSNPYAFYGVPANVAVYIPCGTLALFAARMPEMNNFIESQISFSAVSEDNNKGTVQILNTPTCSNPNAVINAVAAANYRFDHWSDGNTDNPRSLYVTGDTSLVAYFKSATSIQEMQDANVKVYVSGNNIVVEFTYAQGYENEMVTVYDVLGREIAKARLEGNNLRLSVQPSGIYIVKINGLQPCKVVVQ